MSFAVPGSGRSIAGQAQASGDAIVDEPTMQVLLEVHLPEGGDPQQRKRVLGTPQRNVTGVSDCV